MTLTKHLLPALIKNHAYIPKFNLVTLKFNLIHAMVTTAPLTINILLITFTMMFLKCNDFLLSVSFLLRVVRHKR